MSVLHVAGSTFHVRAAAVFSISRPVAPAVLRFCHDPRTLQLPPVDWLPYFFGCASACTTEILDQSASSSSATIIDIEVQTPWPISERATEIITDPSVPILIQPLGANASSFDSRSSSPRAGR